MAYNLERGIFGVLEHQPGESATAAQVAAALTRPLPPVERKLRELARGGYLTRDGETYTLSHDLD